MRRGPLGRTKTYRHGMERSATVVRLVKSTSISSDVAGCYRDAEQTDCLSTRYQLKDGKRTSHDGYAEAADHVCRRTCRPDSKSIALLLQPRAWGSRRETPPVINVAVRTRELRPLMAFRIAPRSGSACPRQSVVGRGCDQNWYSRIGCLYTRGICIR